MEENKYISDELLAKYMSGMASPEEEAAVLDYLAENDGNLEDFIHISEAVVLNNLVEKNERRKRKRVVRYISAAAALALLVIVSLFAIHRFDNPNDQFAQEQPPSVEVADSTIVNSNNDSIRAPKQDVESNSQYVEQKPSSVEPKHYADSSRKVKYASMIYPSKKRTSISKEKKQVGFRWNTDAVEIHLNVKSDDGRLVTDQRLAKEKYYNLSLPDNVDTLLWRVVFTYADGTTSEQNGMIIRWDTGLQLNN